MNKLINNPTIGSDIEFFLQNKNTGEFVSAEGLIQGTKYDPFHFDPKNEWFMTSLDNVSAEGNIPPARTAYQFYKGVEKLIAYINSTIPKDLIATSIPSVRFDQKYLQTENAQVFGCESSINCWTLEDVKPMPTGDNLRAIGKHIHVGYEKPSEEMNYNLAKALDLFLGVPAVIIEPDNERKVVGYGCAGNMRHKNYGMEYRVLSSHFASSKDLIQYTFKNTMKAIRFINEGKMDSIDFRGKEIQDIINKNDKQAAKALCKEFKITY